MKIYARAPTQKSRRIYSMRGFRGVDFSSSPVYAESYRASDAANFLMEHGVNRKRNGWEQVAQVNGRVNGIFPYNEGDQEILLVHAGTRFYRVVLTEDGYEAQDVTTSGTYARAAVDVERLTDTRSQAFAAKKRLYIIGCGDFLVYGSWNDGESYELRRVADNEDTYIPTTCIRIKSDYDEDTRVALDDVNLISRYRKNTACVGGYTFTVDAGSIDRDSEVTVEGTMISVRYDPSTQQETRRLVQISFKNDKEKETEIGEGLFSYGVLTIRYETGEISLGPNYEAPSEDDNLTITYGHTVPEYEERITRCAFGVLFGVDGNSDRLFLAGNRDHPNIDFHSEADDFTYFGDLATTAMGSDAAPIGGYARLSDSTLVIYKTDAEREASIYYRTGRYDTYTDAEGYLDEVVAVFPIKAGSVGEVLLARGSVADFAGDHVMLSRNGVFGVVLSDNVATTERYTRERSRTINRRLLAHKNLHDAVGYAFGERYYLAVDGVCYVANAGSKYATENSADGSYSYEWSYLENVPARVFATVDGRLYFGTEDGRICVFGDGYVDRTFFETEAGEVAPAEGMNGFTLGPGVAERMTVGDRVVIRTAGCYAFITSIKDADGERIFVGDDIDLLYEGDLVKVNEASTADGYHKEDGIYEVRDVDRAEGSFSLHDPQSGERVEVSGGGPLLSKDVSGVELYVEDVQPNLVTLSWQKGGATIHPSAYGWTDGMILRVIREKVVKARWYTPAIDLGTNTHAKTLLGFTYTLTPETGGRVTVGYETRRRIYEAQTAGLGGFDLSDLSFEDFSFESPFAASYTKRLQERNVNYVIFRILSEDDRACELGGLSIEYKINNANKGVV